jgi:hypothetical protein
MDLRQDKYVLNVTANCANDVELDASISKEMSLAELQDMIGSIIEHVSQATSFQFIIVRCVTHTNEVVN